MRTRQATWSGLDAVAAPIASLLATAGLVRSLGPQDYGVLVVVLAVSAFSTAINPAIVLTTTKLVSESLGRRESDASAVARLISGSVSLVALLSGLFLGAVWLWAEPLSKLIFGTAIAAARTDLHTVLLLAVLAVCLQQIDSTFAAVLRGFERFKLQALFEIASRLTAAAAGVAAGWLTSSIGPVLLAQCGALLLSAILRATLLRRVVPGGAPTFAKPRAVELSRIFSFGRWMWLNAVATAAYTSLDRVIVGRFLGPAAAAEFFVYLQLAQLVHFIPASLAGFSFPVFSRLFSAGAIASARDMYRKLFVAIFIGALALTVAIVLFQKQALTLFAGRVFQPDGSLTLDILIAGFFVLALNVAPYFMLLGQGASKLVSLVTSAMGLLSLTLALVLVPLLGLQGAGIARLTYVVGTPILLVRAHRALKSMGGA